MTPLDVLAWLVSHLHPVVIAAPAADDGPAWLRYMPAVTAGVAAIGVGIAGFALRASRRSADNSAASVEKADAALRGTVRPILDAGLDQRAIELHVRNLGSGVALDVHVIAASVVVAGGGHPMYVGWFEEPTTVPILAAGDARALGLSPWNVDTDRSPLVVLIRCRDVNGTTHWTYGLVGRSPLGVSTHVGSGEDYPPRVRQFLDKYAEARAERAEKQRQRQAEWEAEDAASPAPADP